MYGAATIFWRYIKMSVFKKISALLTAVGIAAACTGCSDTTYGLEVDGVKVPAGVYIYYANSAYGNALSMLTEENPDLDTEDDKAVKAAMVEGVPTLQWIQDKATELCVNYVAVEKKFDELGLELDAETKDTIDMMVDYYWPSYEEAMIENGVSEDSFVKVMTSSYKSEMLFDYYYGMEGEFGASEKELKEHYLDNNIRAQYVAFKLYDGEGNLLKSDGKAEMMDMVEEYEARVADALANGGVEAVMTEMNVIQDEYNAYCTSISNEAAGITEETTSATTTEEEETTTSAEETEETTEAGTDDTTEDTAETTEMATATDEDGNVMVVEDEENGTETTAAEEDEETTTTTVSYPNERVIAVINEEDYDDPADITYNPSQKVYEQLLKIKGKDYGKPYIVEEDETYYLVVRYDLADRATEEDLWNENQIYSVQIDMFNKDFDEDIKEWAAALSVTKNEAAYKRYDPFKFTF